MSIEFRHNNITHADVRNMNIIMVSIPKDAVMEIRMKEIKRIMNTLEDCGTHGMDKVVLSFDGWDNDPREIFEIDEIRKFVQKIFREYPYILFYLMSDARPFMKDYAVTHLLLGCLGDVIGQKFPTLPDKMLTDVRLPETLQHKLIAETIRHGVKQGAGTLDIMAKLKELKALTVLS